MSTALSHTSTYASEFVKFSVVKITALFTRITEFCYQASNAHKCSKEVERLMALSDDDLGKLGLARRDIASHAFRKWMQI